MERDREHPYLLDIYCQHCNEKHIRKIEKMERGKFFKRKSLNLAILLISLCIQPTMGQTADKLPLRLRVGTYNVGHFNQGSLGGFQSKNNALKSELHNWRNWIGQQGLDILALNEWNTYFDKDSTCNAQRELLDPYYQYVYWGANNTWIHNGIATNFVLQNVRQKKWDGDYYAIIGDLVIGEKTVTIISTHIPWQKEWHQRSFDALKEELKKYEYFICMGDMNANDANQLSFIEDGYNCANGGTMGWFGTAASANLAKGRTGSGPDTNIDNIVTSKNIKIMKVSAPFTHLNDLDHLPILAEVVIVW